MRQLNKNLYKKGVSLITVLLFMLVATIAATATYKWITSENRSSASRMLKSEAHQSAVAGIENARAWMAYHANDVGALIKQYFDGENEPILLDSVLESLEREGQNYNIWLTGVDASSNTYKLKLLSVGEARNGSKHSEVAIFNVNGLYRVKIPGEEGSGLIDFDYNYFGGTTNNQGSMNPTSMLINGNWSGNPNTVEKNFVVTGNATLSGNNIHIGGTACIGGNMNANNGFTGTDAYIAGKSTSFTAALAGDVYFDGDVEMGSQANPGFNITGSVTLAATMKTNQNAFSPKIAGNLCVTDNGQVLSNGTNNDFVVEGHVWMPGRKNVWTGGDNSGSYSRIKLGSKANSEVYIADAYSYNEYKDLRAAKTFTEATNHPKKCKQGAYYWAPYSGAADKSIPICDQNSREDFDGKAHAVYKEVGQKDNGYCLYYMPPGVTDVTFGKYTDAYWKWCREHYTWGIGTGYCSAYNDVGTEMNSYFINAAVNDATTRYRSSYDGNPEYRFLNYANSQITASPYCKQSNDAFRPECGVTPWFQSNGTVYSTKRGSFPSEKPFECAEQVKINCDSIWQKKPGCDGSNYKVDDVIQTGFNSFESYAEKARAASSKCNITVWDNNLSKNMNECYADLRGDETKAEALYNDYLVVKVTSNGLQNPNDALNGKFVIIVENKIGQQNIPPTTANSFAFVYLKEGGSGELQPAVDSGIYNYFFYTESDVTGLRFNNSKLSGTIYAKAETCAKFGSLNVKEMEFNQTLLDDLTKNGVICDAKASSCGGASGSSAGGSGSGSSGIVLGGSDAYYIATSPQLSVSLESQYETSETAPDAAASNVEPSVIVLPRVIYMTTDPVGKLEDYYNIINLNGAEEEKNPSAVSCSPSLNTTTALYDEVTPLAEDIYTCRYQTSKYGDIPFYVVVSGFAGKTPAVSFTQDMNEIVAGGSATISMRVPTSSRSQPMTIDIIVTNIPTGWNVTPLANVTKRTDFDGGSIYTATLSPSVSTVDVFTVTTESSAEQGSIYFALTSPFEGCIIGAPNMERILMTGYAHINRKPVSEYCAKTENSGECSGFSEKLNWKDCNNLLGINDEWVRANGFNISTQSINEQWDAATNSSVSLTPGSDIPSYCEVIIPSSNNTVTDPQNDQSYDLYASIKRRPYTLTVVLDGANDNETKVIVTIDSETKECIATDKACAYTVYAGSDVELAYTVGTSDKFSTWKCSGNNCPTPVLQSTVFDLGVVYNDNTVTAVFNDQDDHCFYEDFTNLKAFCSEGETKCIADCASEPCAANSSADWQMIYGNAKGNGSNVAPVIDAASIYTTNFQNANNQNGTQTLVLNSALAGSNGTLHTMLQTTILASNKKNEFLNSGLLLRATADMSDYLMLNVYGVGSGSDGDLTARLCRASGQGINNSDGCTTTTFSDSYGGKVSVSPTTMIKLEIKADKDMLTLTANVSNTTYTALFNLPANTNDLAHQYVGFALADAAFRVFDIGWYSADYGESCFENPQVFCSFKSNYLGGIIPIDSIVSPWVGTSSWFTEHNCSVEYNYSGSDNTTSKPSASEEYNFSESGQHGVESTTNPGTFEKNASVKIDCPDDLNSSLDGRETNCGAFWVGKVTRCSQNIELSSEIIAGAPDTEKEITFSGANNLREASLIFEIVDLAEGATIQVRLKDEEGRTSLPGTINANGSQTLNVNVMSNIEGFNPQRVTGMILIGTSSYNVTSIQTTCPYAMSISNCTASYNGASWQISSEMHNIVKSKCNVEVNPTGDFEGLSDLDCPASGTFSVPDANLYERVNNGNSTLTYAFSILATSEDGSAVSCVTNEVKFDPTEISCAVKSKEVFKGQGVPVFEYSFTNCPPTGCNYALNLDSENATGTSDGALKTWQANLNNAPALDVGNYTYSVTTMGKTCTDEFKVVEPTPASASNCRIEGDAFKADIVASNDASTWNASVAVTDVLGVIKKFEQTGTTNATFSWPLSNVTMTPQETDKDYIFTLLLNGNEVCTATHTVTGTGPLSSSSSEIESSSSVAGSISVTCGVSDHNYDIHNEGFYSSTDLYFMVKNNVSNDKSPSVELYKDGVKHSDLTLNTYSNWAKKDLGKLAVGSYSYSVKYDGVEICKSDITVKDALSCSVDKTTINLGETFKFTVKYDGDCWGSTLTGEAAPSTNCSSKSSIDFTITPTSIGEKSYTYSITNGSLGTATCSQTVTVNEIAPTITCPADQTVTVGSTITVTPATLTGCTNCGYKIEKTGYEFINESSGYSGASVTFTDASALAETTVEYTFTVSNSAGSKDCKFNVNYEETAPTLNCPTSQNATVGDEITITPTIAGCVGGCSYSIETSGSAVTTGTVNNGTSTISFTDASASAETKTYTLKVSNSKSTTCDFTVTYTALSSSSVIQSSSSSAGDGNACKETWSSTPADPITACRIKDGKCYQCNPDRGSDCNNGWLWTGGFDQSWVGYWFVETSCSGGGSTPSSSSAVVVSSSSAGSGGGTKTIGSSAVTIDPGTYTISCSGGGQLICWSTSGEKKFTLDGNECTAYAGEGWGSCGNGTCKASSTLTTTVPISCKGGW